MDIYRSQYTAAQIEASIGKSPRINTTTGEWEIWDISSGKYVGTGVVNVTKDYVDDHYVTAGQLDGSDLGERATAEGARVESILTLKALKRLRVEAALMQKGWDVMRIMILLTPKDKIHQRMDLLRIRKDVKRQHPEVRLMQKVTIR